LILLSRTRVERDRFSNLEDEVKLTSTSGRSFTFVGLQDDGNTQKPSSSVMHTSTKGPSPITTPIYTAVPEPALTCSRWYWSCDCSSVLSHLPTASFADFWTRNTAVDGDVRKCLVGKLETKTCLPSQQLAVASQMGKSDIEKLPLRRLGRV
jgi:hypothetical protein